MKNFKKNFTAADMSQFGKQTLYNVIADKINFVLDKVQHEKPHYMWLSKNQLVKSSKIFKELGDNHPVKIPIIGHWSREGFTGHMPARQPSEREMENMVNRYGYALKYPPPGILSTIQAVFRDFEDKKTKGTDIVMVPCRGYIDQNNRLVEPTWNTDEKYSSNFISGYVIYRKDPEGIKAVNEYLMHPDTPLYEKYQMLRARRTGPGLRASKVISAEKMSEKALMRHNTYVDSINELTTNVDEPDWNKIRGIGPGNIDED